MAYVTWERMNTDPPKELTKAEMERLTGCEDRHIIGRWTIMANAKYRRDVRRHVWVREY